MCTDDRSRYHTKNANNSKEIVNYIAVFGIATRIAFKWGQTCLVLVLWFAKFDLKALRILRNAILVSTVFPPYDKLMAYLLKWIEGRIAWACKCHNYRHFHMSISTGTIGHLGIHTASFLFWEENVASVFACIVVGVLKGFSEMSKPNNFLYIHF